MFRIRAPRHVTRPQNANTVLTRVEPGAWGYAPNGFVSRSDELALAHAASVNPWVACMRHQYDVIDEHADRGDEIHEQTVWAYVPTEQQVGAAVAVINMQREAQGGGQLTDPRPGLSSLVKGLYQQAAAFWQESAAANTEGW